MCVLYMHISPSGKKYIGITSCDDPNERWRCGKGYGDNTIFGKAIKKYGWENFQHVIIKDKLTLDEANILEKEYISLYKTTDSNFGYNMQSGGNVKIYNESMRKYIGRKTKIALSDPNNPIHNKSEIWLNNISKALTGRRLSDTQINNMVEAKKKNGSLVPKDYVINNLVEYTKRNGSYNKGKHLSDSTKDKIRKRKLGSHIHSTEWKKQLSEKMKGNTFGKHPMSEETKIKMSNIVKRMRWIHNDYEERRVLEEQLDSFINNGWVKGRRVN